MAGHHAAPRRTTQVMPPAAAHLGSQLPHSTRAVVETLVTMTVATRRCGPVDQVHAQVVNDPDPVRAQQTGYQLGADLVDMVCREYHLAPSAPTTEEVLPTGPGGFDAALSTAGAVVVGDLLGVDARVPNPGLLEQYLTDPDALLILLRGCVALLAGLDARADRCGDVPPRG